jgi:hypothetical protein
MLERGWMFTLTFICADNRTDCMLCVMCCGEKRVPADACSNCGLAVLACAARFS